MRVRAVELAPTELRRLPARCLPGRCMLRLAWRGTLTSELTQAFVCSQSWKGKRGGQGARGEGILDDNVRSELTA